MLRLLAVLGSAAAVVTPPSVQSWPDLLHGWKASRDNVVATDDGGRSWHTVLRGGGLDTRVVSVTRTSAAAGIVVVNDTALVTRDAGRHWYVAVFPAPHLLAGDAGTPYGSGRLLFWSFGHQLQQARAWPPPRIACGGHWYHSFSEGFNVYGPRPRNICFGGDGVHLKPKTVFAFTRVVPGTDAVPDLLLQAAVPGGVFGFGVDPNCNTFEYVVVYRNGRALTRTLPGPTPIDATGYANWPTLTIAAENGTWLSPDGGITWAR